MFRPRLSMYHGVLDHSLKQLVVPNAKPVLCVWSVDDKLLRKCVFVLSQRHLHVVLCVRAACVCGVEAVTGYVPVYVVTS